MFFPRNDKWQRGVSVRLPAAWGLHMKNYSIVRVGNEYVVLAGDKSVLKIASRRRAARLVTDAAGLLDLLPSQAVQAEPPIACDLSGVSCEVS
jgi:hypothetical protein